MTGYIFTKARHTPISMIYETAYFINTLLKRNRSRSVFKIVANSPFSHDLFRFGGVDFKAKYRADWVNREIPATTKKTGDENVYRNLALNPGDVQGIDPVTYPHAWTNSESGYLEANSAKSAIDGVAEKGGNAWRPNYRHDAFLEIDLGHEALVDRIDVVFDLNEEGADVWTKGKLEFSDGTSVDVQFDRTTEKQSITFETHETTSVRLSGLECEKLASPKGIAELEVWGVSK